jgi:hypothetical protein
VVGVVKVMGTKIGIFALKILEEGCYRQIPIWPVEPVFRIWSTRLGQSSTLMRRKSGALLESIDLHIETQAIKHRDYAVREGCKGQPECRTR